MAWNEPGGGNRDPWGSGRDPGPPDLDEVIRKLTDRFGGLFGGKGGDRDERAPGSPGFKGMGIIIALIVVGWLLSGIYIVDAGKRGVVLQFGRYLETTGPGPHWRLPFPFQSHQIVDVEQRRVEEIGYRSRERQGGVRSMPDEALMLTQDENIVDVRLAVQYYVSDPRAFLFSVKDPQLILRQVIESATRETVGKSTMDFVLTQGRSEVVADIKRLGQQILDSYGAGLMLANVTLQDAQPPEEVQDAFADAIKSREDEQRLKNEAEAYANEIVPKARGQAARQLQEAQAYRDQAVARAEGDASRFQQLLVQYQKAPEVTRERLYLETMEAILGAAGKVLVDVPGGNNLIYLPLDRLLDAGGRATARDAPPIPAAPAAPAAGNDDFSGRLRDSGRERESR